MWYLIFYFASAIWVFVDGNKRKMNAIPWAFGTFFIGPLALPVYVAKRPLLEGEVREGGTAWNILKNFALYWTALMAIAAIWGISGIGKGASSLHSDAEKAGYAIGTALGLGLIGAIWFFPMLGALVLGFFLKQSTVIEKGTEQPQQKKVELKTPDVPTQTPQAPQPKKGGRFCPFCNQDTPINVSVCIHCGKTIPK